MFAKLTSAQCMNIYFHICICIFALIDRYWLHVCMHILAYACMCIPIHIYVNVCLHVKPHICKCTCIHAWACTWVYNYIHMCIYLYICTHVLQCSCPNGHECVYLHHFWLSSNSCLPVTGNFHSWYSVSRETHSIRETKLNLDLHFRYNN